MVYCSGLESRRTERFRGFESHTLLHDLKRGNMYLSLQGNLGLSKAIDYFTSHGITVCIPLNDTQKYDLVADFNGGLQRVSVKTSRFEGKYGGYNILLKNCGGSSGKSKVRHFDNSTCDYVFVLTGDDKIYLIPSSKIEAKSSIVVGNKYTEYEVAIKQFSSFAEEIKKEA